MENKNAPQVTIRYEVNGRMMSTVVDRFPYLIGRDSYSVQLALPDGTVSRVHARLLWQNGAVLLENMSATNWTAVNGQRISVPTPLHGGDQAVMGSCKLTFELRDQAPQRPQGGAVEPPGRTTFFQPTVGQTNLVVLEQNGVVCYDLNAHTRWSVGRAVPENRPDIPLSSPVASRKHGQFALASGVWVYYDQGSLNGTLYNGQKIPNGADGRPNPVTLKNGDVLEINRAAAGQEDSRGVWMFFSTQAFPGQWAFFPIAGRGEVRIGRDPSRCDLSLPLPYVSALHAQLTLRDGVYCISDCGSKAGTWLNGARLQGEARLKEKDRVSICDCHFIYTGAGLIYNCRRPGPPGPEIGGAAEATHAGKAEGAAGEAGAGNVILKARIHSKRVHDQSGHGEKELIHDVRVDICSGELVALLGESGAGKSTLMNCMNGTEQDGVQGVITLYGENLYQNYERLKYVIGNVPQKNILHETLSVEEELRNAAMLRLPGDTSRREIKQHIDEVLQALNLEPKRRTLIKKLSGGEQKRVNIGIELVADRQVLCLDEPDAGLDPLAKKELFTTLRNLAHQRGKSVLVIIHDVSEIDLFDKIVMMAKVNDVGRLAFAGTPAAGREHFHIKNLIEAYDVIQKAPERYIMVN